MLNALDLDMSQSPEGSTYRCNPGLIPITFGFMTEKGRNRPKALLIAVTKMGVIRITSSSIRRNRPKALLIAVTL